MGSHTLSYLLISSPLAFKMLLSKLPPLTLLSLLPCVLGQIDPGQQVMDCVDGGTDLDTCTVQEFEAIRPYMGTGITGLKLPVLPMDPMYVDEIDFKFETVNIKFLDLDVKGIQKFVLKKSTVDKNARKWNVVMFLPRLEVVGKYRMSGSFGIDLGVSEGPETFNATEVTLTGTASIGSDANGKFSIDGMNLGMDFGNIAIAMHCLFPRDDGSCCPGKWKESCNPIFARTIHTFINKDGDAFVDKFRPQISAKLSEIIKVFLERGLQNLDASYVIN